MTCHLNTYGKISNLINIVKYLNQKDDTTQDEVELFQASKNHKNEWSNDWGFDETEEKKELKPQEKKEKSNGSNNWFDSLQVCFSPCGNLLVIASKLNMIICQSKWDLNSQAKFSISSRKDLNENENEYITSILCVPLASQKVSGEGLLDWTCIIVGFNTGNIQMFTENGTSLITQMFHDTKVLKIKCRTFEHPKYIGWVSQPEEIEILYEPNVLVCLDGANLYHYLRAARKYAANIASDQNDMKDAISSMSLDYKKWRLDSQELISDFTSAGLTSENRFDQLFAASTIGGPNEKFESIPPMSNRYLTCGQTPFISFYYAIEGLGQPVLLEVKAVAGRITSSLMNAAKGWMGFNKSSSNQQAKSKPKIEPPTSLGPRYGVQDYRRNGETIIVSPGNNLAATTDSFGRVILFDVVKGIAIRIFKGYRDAQIGWVWVDDESEEKINKRYALYLLIYAPRRGLLEVWGCQQGIRVAAFNVGKNSKLIYPGYFMLSLNGNLLSSNFKTHYQQLQCMLLDSEGVIKTLHIPFHLILSDKSNQRVRDTMVLKKLKSLLKESTRESESLWTSINLLLDQFKTESIKQQALEKILSTSYLSPEKIYKIFQQQMEIIEKQKENLSGDAFKLGQFCYFNLRLVKSYLFVIELKQRIVAIKPEPEREPEPEPEPEPELEPEQKPEEKSEPTAEGGESKKNDEKNTSDEQTTEKSEPDSPTKILSEKISIDEDDLNSYLEFKRTLVERKQARRRVKFSDNQLLLSDQEEEPCSHVLMDLSKYISCFDHPISSTTSTSGQTIVSAPNSRFYDLSKTIGFEDKKQLGSFLFAPFLGSDLNVSFDIKILREFLTIVPIRKMILLDLIVHAWLSESFSNILYLYRIVYLLSGCAGHLNDAEYDLELKAKVTDEEQQNQQQQTDESCQTSGADFWASDESDDNKIENSENGFIAEYLPKFKNLSENSNSLVESLLLTWIIRSILIRAQVETNQPEMLNILSHRLYCLIKLNVLLLHGQKTIPDLGDDDFLNIRSILTKNKGILSELVAQHIVLNQIPPKLLSIFDDEDEIGEITRDEIKSSREEYASLLNDQSLREFYDILQETRKYLPKALESDILLVNCAWQAIDLYNRDTDRNIVHLENCLRYCGEIGNAILKQGILSLIWHANICKRLASLTDFIDRNGKVIRDRLLRKEVGINEEAIIEFLKCVMTLLDLIMDANCNLNEVPIFNYDQFWRDFIELSESSSVSTNMFLSLSNNDTSLALSKTKPSSSSLSSMSGGGSKQLVELAAEQKHVNYHLCAFHYQLVRMLYLIIKFNMKPVKPYAFFDTKGKQALFSELHTHPLISNDVDIKILNARKLFLTKALNAIMKDVDSPTHVRSKLADDVNENLNVVFNLSKDIGVDEEYIKRYYCCLLYALDYHYEAEKILHVIKESELIASQLLVVVGLKVCDILEANFDTNLIAILSTNLNSWLKSLGQSEYRVFNLPSKQPILDLMGIILSRMPEKFAEYKLAIELLDFIENPQFQIKVKQ